MKKAIFKKFVNASFASKALYPILDSRYDNINVILITTNYTLLIFFLFSISSTR